MTIALIITDRNIDALAQGLSEKLPQENIQCWPNIKNKEDVDFAVSWNHPVGEWLLYPNLDVICSLGAGVDSLIKDKQIPKHIDICRIVDSNLSAQMSDYVLGAIMMLHCHFEQYLYQQRRKLWQPISRQEKRNVTILGIGKIGHVVAEKLILNGFQVTGWSRSPKNNCMYATYSGIEGLGKAVKNADYIVNVLPSTQETLNLINKDFFNLLPQSTNIINVGRGETINESDLLEAIAEGQVNKVVLDVFKHEPLSKEHPFWSNDNIIVTPHISAITNQHVVIEQIVENYMRFKENKNLMNKIDRGKGY